MIFQRQAENCANYLRKGGLTFVEGSLQTRKWQDQQGQEHSTTEIRASRVQFLDRKGSQNVDDKRQESPDSGKEFLDSVVPPDPSIMDNMPWDRSSSKRHQPDKAFPNNAKETDVPPF